MRFMQGFMLTSLAIGALVPMTEEANAQTQAAAASRDTIIVTAQRRAQDVQEVPVAVTAFNGSELASSNIVRIDDIASRVPSLFVSSPTIGTTRINIRGIGSEPNNVGLGNSIPNYVDGVAMGPGRTLDVGYFDLEAIEVLRGPQGTLFGRNAVGGAVLVRTRQPEFDQTAGGLGVTLGDFGTAKANGYLNWGGDRSAFRIAGNIESRSGYLYNTTRQTDVNEGDNRAIRAQARFKLNDAWSLTLRTDASVDDVNGSEKAFVSNAAGGRANPLIRNYVSVSDQPTITQRETWSASAEVTRESGGYKFVSLTNFGYFDYFNIDDVDYTATNALYTTTSIDQEQYSQEFRIESPVTDRFSWVAGLYYFREIIDSTNGAGGQFAVAGGAPNANTIILIADAGRTTDAYSAFGQGELKVTDKLSLILGARYTNEESRVRKFQPTGRQALGISPINITTGGEDKEWSGTAKVTFAPMEDVMLFAGYSRGFKASGFNLNAGGVNDITAAPEFVDAFEAGIRSEWFDRRFRLNATVFQYDYTDLQRSTFIVPPGGGLTTVAFGNAGAVESSGYEIETQVRATDELTIGGTFSQVDAKFVNYLERLGNGTIVNRSGNTPARTPENAWSAYLDYSRDIGSFVMEFRADWQYRDETFVQDSNVTTLKTDKVNLGNVRLSLAPEGGRWEVAAFVRNVTDEKYIVSMTSATGAVAGVGADLGAPRVYGVQVRVDF